METRERKKFVEKQKKAIKKIGETKTENNFKRRAGYFIRSAISHHWSGKKEDEKIFSPKRD